MESVVQPAHRVLRESKEIRVCWACPAKRVTEVKLVILVKVDSLVTMVSKVKTDLLVYLAHQVRWDPVDSLAKGASLDSQDHRVSLVAKVSPVLKEILDHLEHLVHPVRLGHPDLLVHLDHKVS